MSDNHDEEWVVCSCGEKTRKGETEGWIFTDAPWCPECKWLA